jgi:GNAT superfamily N-acetyltransferase
MQIIEVGENRKRQKAFLEFPSSIYKGNKYWIRPLDNDIEKIFDRTKNPLFDGGDCVRFLAIDDAGKTLARVAAFVNPNTATQNEQPTGGMGFFECVDNQVVAFAMFDKCKTWLQEQGMEAMDGPVNFGERDNWWGLHVAPHDAEPTWGMFYHYEYYRAFFENYGFKDYFQQYTFLLPIPEVEARKVVRPALFEIANRIYNTPGYDFRHVSKKELPKFAEDFRIIYNKAWAKNMAAGEMTPERAASIMQTMKPILEEELMWFGYHNDKPIAFFIMIPELNQIIKHIKGKLNLIGKMKWLYHTLMKTNKKARGVIFGVIPEYQGRGIEAAVALSFSKACWTPNYQYKTLELNWIADFNPKMLKVTQALGAKKHKTYITYRYLFDRNKEFKRCSPI